MKKTVIFSIFSILFMAVFIGSPVTAMYNFDELPLECVAQGEVRGDVLTFGTYGLGNPPMECTFNLPEKPVWARVYMGVWGGTEKYTGRAEINVNNLEKVTYSLYGENDKNNDVYATGYGVYWIGYDASNLLRSGENRVTVNTSRGEEGNRMDGRVYGIFVVAVVEDDSDDVIQYWVAEGNANLHGEGWSGANPTRLDTTSCIFDNADLTGLSSAQLTVLLLATTKGQPDYVTFNSYDLGTTPLNTDNYPGGAKDIGNEHCFDAGEGTGTESRYVDVETFDVTELMTVNNSVSFERGRDLNKDGVIDTSSDKPEGEDYVHPCSIVLTAKKASSDYLPDFSVDSLRVENGYAGERATVTAEVRNYGAYSEDPVVVTFYAGDTNLGEDTIMFNRSGVGIASAQWDAKASTILLSAEADTKNDNNPSNNKISEEIVIGSLPDLFVEVQQPYRAGETEATPANAAPLSSFLVAFSLGIGAAILRPKKPGGPLMSVLIAMLVLTALLCAAPVMAEKVSYTEYTIPVNIINSGGSQVSEFWITVYLDGEKQAYKQVEGIGPEATLGIDIPIFTTPGTHAVRVVVNEDESVKEQRMDNNVFEGSFEFK